MAPPLYVKGGVWTNVEDEILKAAVQKYGIYEWERISSLLPKKSAKQVKARWEEYLSPLINKSEWSTEEDKKLLDLHKIFPNQWRSIANALNRTAVQCVERYQKLIDEAAGTQPDDDDNLGLSGPGIETLPAVGASTNAISTGDVNFNAESKPAMPDDEDLPDDEREMLAEAKARLGNIQGKKAKRKARERMLEESKRIALLQKRRDLKAAGININLTTKNKKKRKEFDYNADIYQEIIPKAGPYDVSEEVQENTLEQNKFTREVSTKGMSMKDIDDRIAKEKSKRDLALKKQQKKNNKRVFEGDEELNDERDNNIKRLKLESAQPKKNRSVIAKLIKSSFEKLPAPIHESGKVFPAFGNDQDEVNTKEQDTLGFDSQVAKRQLPILHPQRLQNINELNFSSALEKEITEECYRLIKYDHKKYQDSLYDAPIVETLDQKLLDKVNLEIDEEISKMDTRITKKFTTYQLPETYEVAEKVIDNLHTLHKRNEALTNRIESSAMVNYEQLHQEKLSQLTNLATELAEVDLQLQIEKRKQELDEVATKNEISKLHDKLGKLNRVA